MALPGGAHAGMLRAASQGDLDGAESWGGVHKSASFPPVTESYRRPRGVLKTTPYHNYRPDLMPLSFIPDVDSPRQVLTPKRVSFAPAIRMPSNQALSAHADDIIQDVDMSDVPHSPNAPPSPSVWTPSTPLACAAARPAMTSCDSPPASPSTQPPASPLRRTASLLAAVIRRAAGAGDISPWEGTAKDLELHRTRMAAVKGKEDGEDADSDEEEGWAMYLGGFGCSPDLAKEWGL